MMGFRTFDKAVRRPAKPLDPAIDPAGWEPASLANLEDWSYRLTGADIGELRDGIDAVRHSGIELVDIEKSNFPLRAFGDTLADVKRELTDGRGVVMLRGFPVDRWSREDSAIAFIGLGGHLGKSMSQNKWGHILGHVKDLGGSYADPLTRGYMTRDEMLFHADACDFVGLLCLQTSKSGGESRVASSVTVYNRILKSRPDLAKVLCEDFYRSRTGEVNPGDPGYYKQPIFSFIDGYFSATGAGAAIDKAHTIPGVPPYTAAQKEAVALYRKTVEECAADIPFAVGDVQFLNNFVMLHTRRAYQDWPDRKRHLLRLWLSDPSARPIPPEQRRGRVGVGVNIAGVKRNAPLDVESVG
jgi:hypothetical protein